MAATKVTVEEKTEPKEEYFELRIPKIVGGRVPVSLTIILMLASFLAGLLTMKVVTQNMKPIKVTDATGAFISYAKELKLDTKKFEQCLDAGKYAQNITNDTSNGSSFGVSGTPSFFINGRFIVGALDYSVFKQLIDQELSGNRSTLPEEEPLASGSATLPSVAVGNLPLLGDTNAPVTIVEFSDFQCPFCESFFTNAYPQIKADFIDTGKVKLAFRHYPLSSIHPNADKAHQASECANEQGKFWNYHDLLFKKQADWTDLPLVSTTES